MIDDDWWGLVRIGEDGWWLVTVMSGVSGFPGNGRGSDSHSRSQEGELLMTCLSVLCYPHTSPITINHHQPSSSIIAKNYLTHHRQSPPMISNLHQACIVYLGLCVRYRYRYRHRISTIERVCLYVCRIGTCEGWQGRQRSGAMMHDDMREWCQEIIWWRNDVMKNNVAKKWCSEGIIWWKSDVVKEWCSEGMIMMKSCASSVTMIRGGKLRRMHDREAYGEDWYQEYHVDSDEMSD